MKRKPEHTHVLRLGDQTVILYVDDRRPDDLPMAEIECDDVLRPNDETVRRWVAETLAQYGHDILVSTKKASLCFTTRRNGHERDQSRAIGGSARCTKSDPAKISAASI